MKSTFLLCTIMWVWGITSSCKKDTASPAPDKPLLTSISRNGLTLLELAYDIDKKLIRLNYYSNGALSTYTLYEYDENEIRESRRYDADDYALEYRRVFTMDNFGRVIRSDNYSLEDSEDLSSITEYEYNASDQLISEEFRVPGEPVFNRDEYSYDQQGNLVMKELSYYPGGPGESLRSRLEYTPGSKSLPPEWHSYVFLLTVPGLDSWMRDLFSIGGHYTSWNDEGEISSEYEYTASQQQYNSHDYLTSQIITRDDLLDDDPDGVNEYTYSYSQ